MPAALVTRWVVKERARHRGRNGHDRHLGPEVCLGGRVCPSFPPPRVRMPVRRGLPAGVSALCVSSLQFEPEFPHAPFISTLSAVVWVCKQYVATFLELIFKAVLISLLSRFRIYFHVCHQQVL